ncbi:MAG TPA: pyridoxamine 5'-phosphate oxidase family protein, partial [Gaiellaceae bacterium]|nr:pyridoxamine 5'-phosphate oxidase family protein [Gaiellaceae bacterium]
ENSGVAARILRELGPDAETIREELFRLLGGKDVAPLRPPDWRGFRRRRRQRPARIEPMTDEVRELFGGGHFVHLATLLPDGSPHSVPLWTIVREGRIAFFTQPGSRTAQNLRHDQRVALSVVDRANRTARPGRAAA